MRSHWLRTTVLAAAVAAGDGVRAADPPGPEAEAFFETQIRPVFAEHCTTCHGPEKQMMALRLDYRDGLLKGGESGPVIVPGDSANSALVKALRYDGPIQMPPTGALPAETVDAIAAWIDMGAPWPGGDAPPAVTEAESFDAFLERTRRSHWAFAPVGDPELPAVSDASWARTSVDSFVLAGLDEAGLAPSPEADRATLLRRLYYDLVGLPPAADEVAAFLADDRPDAYERAVETLLASPHYGERWGRYWLDVARYSDTKGYVFQEERDFPFSYTYRDYVVRAFNEDLPYDTFLKHQLAADQMELGADKRPLAAMGYLTLGRRFVGNIHDVVDDRIDVVTRGMLGLTVSCARCHDHKYDPISAADYYALYGVFRSSTEPGEFPLIAEPDPESPAYQEFLRIRDEKQAEVESTIHELHVELLTGSRTNFEAYLLAGHDAREMDRPALQALAKERDLLWQMVERWRDFLKAKAEAHDPVWGAWTTFAAMPAETFAADAPAVARLFAENKADGQLLNGRIAAAFAGDAPQSMADVAARYGKAVRAAETMWLDRAAAEAQAAQRAGTAPTVPGPLADGDAEALRQVLYGTETPANIPAADVWDFIDVPKQDRIRQRRNALARHEATHPGRPDRAMALVDGELFNPYVFKRGKPGNRGDDVPRRFLTVLAASNPAPFEKGSGRLELAEAIAHPDNPLTARVFVNRVWMGHFGNGLVGTPSDFGLRSDAPTHPELLDHLARRFMDEGWSAKNLHRLIVLSSAYRQSSADRADGLSADPENRLVWRQNRRRLDFEAMRDTILKVAGVLDPSIGGHPVEIAAPPFSNRRTVYARIERQNLPAVFRTFDFASPDTHAPMRLQTTVPQQALYMMNSPFITEQARALASRSEVAASEGRERVDALYRLVHQRDPLDDEAEQALRFVESQRPLYEARLAEPAIVEWQYGYGALNETGDAMASFAALPHFAGGAWQGGATLPDGALGWASLNNGGGHPGAPGTAVVRRWTAPKAGVFEVRGRLKHPGEKGDGIRAAVVSNRSGRLWAGTAFNSEQRVSVDAIAVEKGDMVDFIVDCGADESFDSFVWDIRIRAAESAGTGEWHAKRDFSGPKPPAPPPLSPWEQYAQVLLMTNELAFVD